MDLITIASLFAMAAMGISLHSISMHLKYYTNPRYQIYICRILLLVPLYACQAWFSLLYVSMAPMFSAIRDIYEGYVIYMFFTLLIKYLGGEDCLIDYLELKSHMTHPGTLRQCCGRITLGRRFLRRVKQGTLQFVLVRPTTAVMALFLHTIGLYDELNWSLKSGYIWVTAINNISVSISLYSLVLLYKATEFRLQTFRPLPKFLSIKAIVFFSYWQGFILSILVHTGMIHDDRAIIEAHPDGAAAAFSRSMGLTASAKATVLQDMLICVEIFFAAIALNSAFSYRDFTDDDNARRPLIASLVEVLDPHDIANDARSTFIVPQGQQSLGPRNMELLEQTSDGFTRSRKKAIESHILEF